MRVALLAPMCVALALALAVAVVAQGALAQGCRTTIGMTRYQCRLLHRQFLNGECGPYPEYANPPVLWIGRGCPTPCARAAAAQGVSPTAFCRSRHANPTYRDGGCHVYSDCNINCEATCSRQKFCVWEPKGSLMGICKRKVVLG